ncbi:uncharacterized protein LOC125034234 [Penaeus chinensis]|uniref:uncharacterized protein LOC125034234 n=1 Tax=Penaeus chinensis TaxID=139456 RepID=UPI001FB814BF|nr:uncharacterized protein LOC125034234 [Penaeus chinensis]
MLDQLSSPLCPPGLEEAARARRWADVGVCGDAVASVGQRVFYEGEAGGREVTLMLTPETKVEAHHLLTPLPIAAFSHALPPTLLDAHATDRGGAVQGTVWVLPPLSLTSLQSLAGETRARLTAAPAEWERQTCLVLLQLVTGLKHMQAQGLEETCLDLTLAARGSKLEGHDPDHRLVIAPPAEHDAPLMSLCQVAAAAAQLFMGADDPLLRARTGSLAVPAAVPSRQAFRALLQLLHQEKAGSLTKVKCILELLLFGPESAGIQGKDPEEVEAVLQKWLDLERATLLHALIRGPLEASVLTKLHLLFLVRSNTRVLREAVKFFEEPEVTEF